jgi:hypothetical protein
MGAATKKKKEKVRLRREALAGFGVEVIGPITPA